jgi:hypothetical protein
MLLLPAPFEDSNCDEDKEEDDEDSDPDKVEDDEDDEAPLLPGLA